MSLDRRGSHWIWPTLVTEPALGLARSGCSVSVCPSWSEPGNRGNCGFGEEGSRHSSIKWLSEKDGNLPGSYSSLESDQGGLALGDGEWGLQSPQSQDGATLGAPWSDTGSSTLWVQYLLPLWGHPGGFKRNTVLLHLLLRPHSLGFCSLLFQGHSPPAGATVSIHVSTVRTWRHLTSKAQRQRTRHLC